MNTQSPFTEEDIQFELLAMTVFDRQFLRAVGDVITQDDFRPLGKSNDSLSWAVSGLALDFYKRNRVAAGSLIAAEVGKWLRDSGASEDRVKRTKDFLLRLKKAYDPSRADVLQSQVRDFKKSRARDQALREMVELNRLGQLDDDKMVQIIRHAVSDYGLIKPREFLTDVDKRIQRRNMSIHRRNPCLMIDPFDAEVKSIGRGHVGLWLAAWKMGKSLAMIWTATSYVWQGLNVLYFTLEDPIDDVEDRFDACISELPMDDLSEQAKELKSSFNRWKRRLRAKIRLVDGTDGGMSVQQIEAVWERERAMGFNADAVIVDYDDEIRPAQRRPERRNEFADIYRDFRTFVAKQQVIGWLAAQATRKAEGQKIVSADMAAEDISKIRKVTMAIGIGQSNWKPESSSRYLWIAAHKFDMAKKGVDIMSAPEKGMFYDRVATLRAMDEDRKHKPGPEGKQIEILETYDSLGENL